MTGIFDNTIVVQVQQANDIVDVISEHMTLTKKGREMVGLCPFHEDHRPSLYVNPVKQIFKCFACSAGGDVFKFVQMRESLTFPQAIERLAQRAGIVLKTSRTARSKSADGAADIDPNRLAKVNAWAAKYFQENLSDPQKGKSARDYIAERKINSDSIKKWQLGLAVSQNELLKAAMAKKVPTQLLTAAGLVVSRRDGGLEDKFVNRLMFPISDVTGRIIGFGGRTLDGADAKYINSPTTVLFDKSNSLYGLDQAHRHIATSETAVVVEGYTDCMMAHQFGCDNVVATLGTSLTAGHGRILRRYAKKVVLLFDSDVAGIEAGNRALEVCLSQHIDIKLASVPEGKDPCDYLLVAGRDKFEQLIDGAVDVLKFKWNRLIDNFDADGTLIDNKAAIEEFMQTVATAIYSGNLSAVDKGLIINRISRIIGLEPAQINAELAKRTARVAKTASYNHIENQKVSSFDLGSGFYAAAQQEILEVLLNEPGLFEQAKQKITPDTFDVPILRQIATVLFEMLNAGHLQADTLISSLLAKVESVEMSSCIVKLAQAGEEKDNFNARLTGALNAVERYHAGIKQVPIKGITDPEKFLHDACEAAVRQNPHNLGMV